MWNFAGNCILYNLGQVVYFVMEALHGHNMLSRRFLVESGFESSIELNDVYVMVVG